MSGVGLIQGVQPQIGTLDSLIPSVANACSVVLHKYTATCCYVLMCCYVHLKGDKKSTYFLSFDTTGLEDYRKPGVLS